MKNINDIDFEALSDEERAAVLQIMNEIADNIDRMKSIEGYLDHQSNIDGISTDPSQRIQDNLDVLNKLMEENNEKIKNLNKKLQNKCYFKIKYLTNCDKFVYLFIRKGVLEGKIQQWNICF